MVPTEDRHLTSKKYVDELIAAELTAPARFEWKVYVNADGSPYSKVQRISTAPV